MSDIVKVVRIDDFRAGREPKEPARDDRGRVLEWGASGGERTLTPHEISHRFAMLAFLRKAR